ncbi:MAG: hypothetical protein U1F68_11965 [Gammaproteobacteria bacterium]
MTKFFCLILCTVVFSPLAALAHDPNAYGGLYRSRDDGATWFPADSGLFLNGVFTVAISPAGQPALAADSGLVVP